MRARLVVFPIKGRNWCFTRSIDPSASESTAAGTPSTVKELWKKISSNSKPFNANAELLVDFISNKMNTAWVGLEKAPEGSFKNKLHGYCLNVKCGQCKLLPPFRSDRQAVFAKYKGNVRITLGRMELGLRLLARVKPSEMLLKSITKDVTSVQITYPPSLNSRLVRRRLRHVALRGTIIHRRYFYGSVSLLPLTTAFAVLPLPNIPFFWVLFRTYSHWRALKGSEKLLQLVSDHSQSQNSIPPKGEEKDSKCGTRGFQWRLEASQKLEELLQGHKNDSLTEQAISDICSAFRLNKIDVLKYRKLV